MITVSVNGIHMQLQSHSDDKEVFDVCVGRLRVKEVLQYCNIPFLRSPPSGYPFATCAFAEAYNSQILTRTHTQTHQLLSFAFCQSH